MNRGKWAPGYTIVEVMIVLAVSGLMFAIAAKFINGKQPQASFKTGVTEMASRVQDTINQVNDGHYTDINFKCFSADGVLKINGGAGSQGTNSDCVFAGKLLYFKQGATTTSDYQVIPMAGLRQFSGTPPTTLAELQPTAIVSSGPGGINLITDMIVPQSLDVSSVVLLNSSGNATAHAYAVGFIQSFGDVDTTGGGERVYKSGSQSIGLVYAHGVNSATVFDQDTIRNNGLNYTNQYAICLTDGTRNATLKVGGDANNLTVVTKYFDTLPAYCTTPVGAA